MFLKSVPQIVVHQFFLKEAEDVLAKKIAELKRRASVLGWHPHQPRPVCVYVQSYTSLDNEWPGAAAALPGEHARISDAAEILRVWEYH